MKSKTKLTGDILAFDIGEARTGVARMHTIARIPEPLAPINHKKESLSTAVKRLVSEYEPVAVIVGAPRSLDGNETAQTAETRRKYESLLPLLEESKTLSFFIDEAGTTKSAELRALPTESVDSVAAGIIAENWVSLLQGDKDAEYEI